MKVIGRTTDGKNLVELSDFEYDLIVNADLAMQKNGVNFRPLLLSRTNGETDIAPVFQALFIWVDLLFSINQIDRTLADLREHLGKGKQA